LGGFAFALLDEIASQWAVGRDMIFGVLLIAVVLVAPGGIAGVLAGVGKAAKTRLVIRGQTSRRALEP
jgi:hypothetical protein